VKKSHRVLIPLFIGLLLSISCSKKGIDIRTKESIIQTIRQELSLHPKATLVDLYKNFFQGRFGPGHMISDPESAASYFYHELETATEFDSVLWQPVGYEENFYRINMCLVRASIIDGQELITAFIESANSVEPPSLESWIEEWDQIIQVIEEMELGLPNYEQDKTQLAEHLKEGNIMFHHSDTFHKYYNPHYRIVSKEYFNKLQGMLREK